MVRAINRLTARGVETITAPGRHADGGGLYFVNTNDSRRWTFLYRWAGKPVEMGLGRARDLSLADARKIAAKARDRLAAGVDPRAAREADRKAAGMAVEPAANTKMPTFGECADELIANFESTWRNAKHRQQWQNTLRDYAKPIRSKPVSEVETADILVVLQPIWLTKRVTASNLRGRLERVLDFAKAKGLRTGENPARWRGHLNQILAPKSASQRGHFKAMRFADIPEFFEDLRSRDGWAALALRFCILTAARTGETLGARWSEIDRAQSVWTIPAARTKAARQHRIPLSSQALEILTELRPFVKGEFVFPSLHRSATQDAPMSNMAMDAVLRRLNRDVTVHGFRSSFRDWASETTEFSSEVCEAALAHIVGDKTERAYRRGDLFDKRRALMNQWGDFCHSKSVEALVG